MASSFLLQYCSTYIYIHNYILYIFACLRFGHNLFEFAARILYLDRRSIYLSAQVSWQKPFRYKYLVSYSRSLTRYRPPWCLDFVPIFISCNNRLCTESQANDGSKQKRIRHCLVRPHARVTLDKSPTATYSTRTFIWGAKPRTFSTRKRASRIQTYSIPFVRLWCFR